MRRFLPTGQLDTGFGRRGVAKLGARGGKLAIADGGVDSRGGVLVTGTFVPSGRPLADAPRRRSFFLARLTGGGDADRGFRGHGMVTTRFGNRSEAAGGSLLVRGSKAVVAGTLKAPCWRPA